MNEMKKKCYGMFLLLLLLLPHILNRFDFNVIVQRLNAKVNCKHKRKKRLKTILLLCSARLFFFCHIYNGMDQQKWWNRMCAFAIYRTVYEETTHTNTPRSYEQCLRHILKRKNRASDSLLQYCYINDVYYVLGLNESNTRNIRNELTTIHDRI